MTMKHDLYNAASPELQRAVWEGDLKVVKDALLSGADPNTLGTWGDPILVGAAYRGHLRIVKMLLDAGADPSARRINGSALEVAISSGHTRVAYALLSCGAMFTWQDANLAALCGRRRVLKALLMRGVDINYLEGYGGTAAVSLVMSAAFAGETDTVQALVKWGADVNLSNENGWTALLSAVSSGHTEVAALLLSLGADAGKAHNSGDTPLTRAAQQGHQEIVTLLKEAGAQR